MTQPLIGELSRHSMAATEEGSRPSSNMCKYFHPKKQRRCKMVAKAGEDFCGEHLIDPAGGGGIRVKCPYGNQ